jgi:hypothetical protein
MSNSIVTVSGDSNQSSPFDSIRGYRADGSEYWTARELMRFLGYIRWDKFIEYIEQAKENIELSGNDVTLHISLTGESRIPATLENPKISLDYELSRLACYHVALACNGKGKPMVAMAKQYFAVQTRKQEIAESIAPIAVERQLPPVRDSIDYLNASKILAAMPEGRLKQLLADKFTAEIALANVNQKQIGSTEPVKQYTTATVRAAQLGFSTTQIGSGSALGTYVKKSITPDFSDWQGQFKVNHYEVSPEFDNCIMAYFNQRN